MRLLPGAIILWIALSQPYAQAAEAAPGSKASNVCDPNVVHTGPRGGKYYRTRDCRKVYLKKGR